MTTGLHWKNKSWNKWVRLIIVSSRFIQRIAAATQQTDLQKEIDAIMAKSENITLEIEELKNAQSSLPELNARKKDYIGDLRKFERLVEQLQSHKARLNDKLSNLQDELGSKGAHIFHTMHVPDTISRASIKRIAK